MKNTSESNTNLKKQLVSGAVYIALAVTVVAVTVSTITSTFSDKENEMPDNSLQHNNLNNGTDETNFDLKLPESGSNDINSDINNFTADTPVSDVKQGVDATVTDKTDKNTPAGNENDNKSENSQNTESGNSENSSDKGALNSETALDEASATDEAGKTENNTVTEENKEPDKSKPESEEPSEPTFEIGYDGYVKPCSGYISKEFSIDVPVYSATMYDYRTHSGIDIACDIGTPVKAVTNGVITDIYEDYMYGTTVVVEHADGVCSIYSNLSADLPAETVVGRSVMTGEILGGVGNTALCESAEANHLHLEMTKDGTAVDPEEYIKF